MNPEGISKLNVEVERVEGQYILQMFDKHTDELMQERGRALRAVAPAPRLQHSAMPQEELAALSPEVLDRHDLIAVTYGSVHRFPWLAEARFGLAVLDEAQAVKNPGYD